MEIHKIKNQPAEKIPVFGEYDVVVAGGGVAGFAAGVAAARRGARTLVVEQYGFLGGTATAGFVGQMVGFTDGQKGIGKELVERLVLMNGSTGYHDAPLADTAIRTKKVYYDPEIMKIAIDSLLTEAGGEALFHTRIVDACLEDKSITGIVAHHHTGFNLIKAKVFIDATFHGDLAAWSGCDWEMGRSGDGKLQPPTLCFRLTNLDLQRYGALPQEEIKRLIERGVVEGKLFTKFITMAPSISENDGIFNMSRVFDVNPIDAKSISHAEMEGRIQVQKILGYLRQNVPGFEKAVLVQTGSILGLRDSRRIMGKYLLTKEDIMTGAQFPDAIAIASYPVDVHDPAGAGLILLPPDKGKYYIPYRCMVTDAVKNLVMAGRCISATDEAHASIRVMATCLALGEAAGFAAAVSIERKEEVHDLDGSLLSRMMYEQKIMVE